MQVLNVAPTMTLDMKERYAAVGIRYLELECVSPRLRPTWPSSHFFRLP